MTPASRYKKQYFMPYFLIARLIAAGMLFLALGNWPYDYYVLLRFVVCGVAAYGTITIYEKSLGWGITFGCMALLWNPILPVHMSKEAWAVLDIIGGCILIISLFIINENGSYNITDPSD